ncbi:hypothetical protein E2C01_064559 [Portunus trituberculatus]|uniref:Uncharacterized protein n=1 Tax=Portunus trituberculatus TaxID=210409 RepID=A0A5B7HL59_PORTR|nr:hypothetical protein [Portunus trituberculatus]
MMWAQGRGQGPWDATAADMVRKKALTAAVSTTLCPDQLQGKARPNGKANLFAACPVRG